MFLVDKRERGGGRERERERERDRKKDRVLKNVTRQLLLARSLGPANIHARTCTRASRSPTSSLVSLLEESVVAYSPRNPACGEGKNIALPSTLIVSFDGPSASAFNLGGHKGTHPSPSLVLARALSLSLSLFLSLLPSFSHTTLSSHSHFLATRRGSSACIRVCTRKAHAFVRDPRHAAHAAATTGK